MIGNNGNKERGLWKMQSKRGNAIRSTMENNVTGVASKWLHSSHLFDPCRFGFFFCLSALPGPGPGLGLQPIVFWKVKRSDNREKCVWTILAVAALLSHEDVAVLLCSS